MPENCFLFTQHNFQPIYIIPVAMALISILIDDIPLTSHHSLRPRLRPRCGDTIDNLSMDGAENRTHADLGNPPTLGLERVTARLVWFRCLLSSTAFVSLCRYLMYIVWIVSVGQSYQVATAFTIAPPPTSPPPLSITYLSFGHSYRGQMSQGEFEDRNTGCVSSVTSQLVSWKSYKGLIIIMNVSTYLITQGTTVQVTYLYIQLQIGNHHLFTYFIHTTVQLLHDTWDV